MKTKNFKFKSMALVLFALVLSSNVWGETYTKATSLKAGDKIVLVCEATKNELTGISTTSTKYGLGTSYTTSVAGTYVLDVVAGSETGSFSFKTGDNYLRWNSGNSLDAVATSVAKNSSWMVTFDASGNATIKNANDATRVIWWNVSSPRFACYTGKSDGTDYNYVQIYKAAPSCTNKVTVTKNSATGGTYTLKAGSASGSEISSGGTVDNCDANATIVVVPNANSNYHCTGVTASNSASVTGPDGSGNYTITYTQGSNISSTINVTFAEDTKHTISFQDNIQLEKVASKEVYDGATFTFPDLDDRTAATEGTCEQMHYHFMGWVISTHTGEITGGDIKTGTSAAVSADATYKAVWAAEQQ